MLGSFSGISIAIIQLDLNGNYVDHTHFGDGGTLYPEEIDISPSGKIGLVGYLQGTADVDPSAATYNLTASGIGDILVLQLNSDFSLDWAGVIGGNATQNFSDYAYDLDYDHQGNFICTGYFEGQADFDITSGTAIFQSPTTSNGGYYKAQFVLKLNPDGSYNWNRIWELNGSYTSIGVKSDNSIYFFSHFKDTVDVDPDPIDEEIRVAVDFYNNNNNLSGLLLELDPTGDYQWDIDYPSPGIVYGFDLKVGAGDQLYLSGTFQDTLDLDPGYFSNTVSSTGSGNEIFVQQLDGTCIESHSIDTIVTCNSHTWVDGNTYTSSNNTANVTSTNSFGCTHTDYLNLTIKNEVTITIPETACNQYTWPENNQTYTSSGQYTETYTAANGCDSNRTLDLTINVDPTANAGSDESVCSNSSFDLSTSSTIPSASNQTSITWSTSGDGSFNDNTLLLPIYTPGSNDISNGNVTLSITANAQSTCTDATDDMVLTIVAEPIIVNAGMDETICENQSFQLSPSAGFFSSASWSTSGDGSFTNPNLLFGDYNPGPNDISNGSVTLTLFITGNGPCGVFTDNMVLTIIDAPTSDAGSDETICEGGNLDISQISSLPSVANHTSVSWSTNGDGSFNNSNALTPVYTPGANDISNGSATLTLTANGNGPCSAEQDQLVLTIVNSPDIEAGANTSVCEGDAFDMSNNFSQPPSAANYNSISWNSSGDGSFNNASLISPIYTPGLNDITNGSVTLTLTATGNTPCSGSSDQMVLSISPAPASDAGSDEVICEGLSFDLSNSSTVPSASNINSVIWSTSGDGTFNDLLALTPIYTPGPQDITAGTVTLTLSANGILPCFPATDDMVLSIVPAPTANSGIDDATCEGTVYDFSSSISGPTTSNSTALLWATNGDGSFNTNTSLTPIYTPGSQDVQNGNVILTMQVDGNAPCGSVTDNMLLTIHPTPNTLQTETVCDSFIWNGNGNLYTNSGIHTELLNTQEGCDSTATLDLTVNYSSVATDFQAACDSFTWIDGNTYSQSNSTSTYTMLNSIGCDSLITLDLTINYTDSVQDNIIACDSLVWVDNQTYFSSDSGMVEVFTNQEGCDSASILNLTMKYSSTSLTTDTGCVNYQWPFNGNWYDETGSYQDTISNQVGCDSIITLELVVKEVDTALLELPGSFAATASSATFQWLDCDNGFIPINVSDSLFTPSESGNYAVAITQDNCTDTTRCFEITGVGLDEVLVQAEMLVYPNPANELVNIKFSDHKSKDVFLINALGKIILRKTDVTTSSFLDTKNLIPGIYFIRAESFQNQFYQKLIIY